jgi:integrase
VAIRMTLTDQRAKNLQPGARPVADGHTVGLSLHPGAEKGHGKWILRFQSPTMGKRRDMGLGAYPEVTIAEARTTGAAVRELIRRGIDPIEQRDAEERERRLQSEAMTFEQAARQVYADLKPGFKNAKHVDQWINTLETYVFPKLGARKVKDLKAADFANVLKPIWLEKAETASRVKQRCGAVMDWCVATDHIQASPVSVVKKLLPKQPGKRERVVHQPTLPWRDIPHFVQKTLHGPRPNASRLMLEFLILTAARSGEARAMTWDEVDFEAAVWTVPAARMKAKTAHRVPLAPRAVEILRLQQAAAAHEQLVFPSPTGKVLSDMALTKFLRDQKVQSSEPGRVATAHGFRSSFRDWASESGFARDLAERALAHTINNQAEAAYHRTDLLEQRRPMMEQWAEHVADRTKEQ